MHPADINAALIKRGSSQSALARELGVSQPLISGVIHSRIASRRVAQEISKRIAIPVEKIWPGVYVLGRRKRRPSPIRR